MKCFVDIETTNLKPWSAEILTAYFIITDEELRVKDEREFRFKPIEKYQWSDEAADVHNISWSDAQLFPDKKESTDNLCSWLKYYGNDFSFICHARPIATRLDLFDYQHLLAHFWLLDRRVDFYKIFDEKKVESTVLSSRKEAEKRFGFRKQSLDHWAKKLGFKLDHHNARSDCHGLLNVYRWQKEITLK